MTKYTAGMSNAAAHVIHSSFTSYPMFVLVCGKILPQHALNFVQELYYRQPVRFVCGIAAGRCSTL